MRYLIMSSPKKPDAVQAARRVAAYLAELGARATCSWEICRGELWEAELTEAEISHMLSGCDMVIAVGGDGTIFRCAKHAAMAEKPILGVNAGRLGFLSQIESENLTDLRSVTNGDYEIMPRMLLELEVSQQEGTKRYYAVNDCVLSRADLGRIADIAVYCGETLVGDYRADGIILATPTGSTAYSLSAGGPIVEPTIDCIVLTPICPHSMYDRSIILNSNNVLTVKPLFDGRQEAIHLIVDGESVCLLEAGAQVFVRCSNKRVCFVDIKKRTFYQTVNQKLRLRG